MDYLLEIGLTFSVIGFVVCFVFTRTVIKRGYIVSRGIELGDKTDVIYRDKKPQIFWELLIFENFIIMALSSALLLIEVCADK